MRTIQGTTAEHYNLIQRGYEPLFLADDSWIFVSSREYRQRIRQLERGGLTTSDAQGVADMEARDSYNSRRAIA